MTRHTHDGWLRAEPAVPTKRSILTPRTRSTMGGTFPLGRYPWQALTSVDPMPDAPAVCTTCFLTSCDCKAPRRPVHTVDPVAAALAGDRNL